MQSEWFYIWFAYGLTWASLAGYAIYTARRIGRAEAELTGDRS